MRPYFKQEWGEWRVIDEDTRCPSLILHPTPPTHTHKYNHVQTGVDIVREVMDPPDVGIIHFVGIQQI